MKFVNDKDMEKGIAERVQQKKEQEAAAQEADAKEKEGTQDGRN